MFADLVVTGPARGTVWFNDLTNGTGVKHYGDYAAALHRKEPAANRTCTFAEWYESWLDYVVEDGRFRGS